jgi:vanillate O-demethylase ferredoxin subunit
VLSRTVRIARRRVEAESIVSLFLADLDGAPLPGFEAGAHIDLEVKPGLIRQYSLCRPAGTDGLYQIAVLRDPTSRGGSEAAHRLAQGDLVRISEPRNAFPLARDAPLSVFFAGGIGVTPLLCMAETLHGHGEAFALHYCARAADQAAFIDHLQEGPYADHVHLHFDDGATEQRLNLAGVLADLDRSAHLYVCGPSGFMAWVIETAEGAGWPTAQVHREYFKAVAPPAATGDVAFTVKLASSGKVIEVAADQTLVAALQSAGVDIPVSCEAGVCGTCLVGVIAGEPAHRDIYLTQAEKAAGDQMLPCCSRAKTPELVLAL